MLDDDSLGDFAGFGSSGDRGNFGPWSVVGALIGAGVGAVVGYAVSGIGGAVAGLLSCAMIGWLVVATFRGITLFLVIFGVVLALTFGWDWLTGAAQ